MLDISVPLPFGGGERGGFGRDGCERFEKIGFTRFQPPHFAATFWVANVVACPPFRAFSSLRRRQRRMKTRARTSAMIIPTTTPTMMPMEPLVSTADAPADMSGKV